MQQIPFRVIEKDRKKFSQTPKISARPRPHCAPIFWFASKNKFRLGPANVLPLLLVFVQPRTVAVVAGDAAWLKLSCWLGDSAAKSKASSRRVPRTRVVFSRVGQLNFENHGQIRRRDLRLLDRESLIALRPLNFFSATENCDAANVSIQQFRGSAK